MAKLYRSLGRATVRVTVEVPVSVVAVLVATARADGYLPEGVCAAPYVPRLLALDLSKSAAMDADYIADEGQGLRVWAQCGEEFPSVPISPHLYDVLPEPRSHCVPMGRLRPWWLRPGQGPKMKRR